MTTHLLKPKRINNKDLLKRIRHNGYKRCQICGTIPGQTHHIKPKGSGGNDVSENIVRLCDKHHRETHDGNISAEYLYELALKRIREEGE